MKKIMIITFAVCITLTVAAQRGHGTGVTRVYIASPAIGFGYSPFYYSPFGYYQFGYPPYAYNSGYRTASKLQLKIDDIKNDYKDKIWSAKHDTSLKREERNKVVHQLKSERDKAVNDVKMNYYKPQKTGAAAPDEKG